MFAKERQSEIIKMINKSGAVTTTELITIFDVSIETVRRDLLELEKKGQLQRVHGGAMTVSKMKSSSELSERIEQNKNDKIELCETAVMLVNENDIIGVDSGSTAIYFAEALKRRLSALTVVTHSLDVFNILTEKEGFQVILCAGHFYKQEKAFYGQLALETMKQLHVQKAFLFPSAISLQNGICDFSVGLQQMQRQLMLCSDKVYFLADNEKFEKNALLKLCDMNSNYVFVTDAKLNEHYRQMYQETGMNIITSRKEV